MSRRQWLWSIGATILAVAATIGFWLYLAGPPDGGPGDPSHGGGRLVGWDTFRRLDRLPYLAAGDRVRQFSSFDRSGGNADAGHPLADGPEGVLLADHSGPGEVSRIWVAMPGGDVRRAGHLRVVLDGRVVLDAPLADIVDGRLGDPFTYPLVANAEQSSGGVHASVPMPFRSSMRITATHDPGYYHVTFRSFVDAEGVHTFDPAEEAGDVVALLQGSGNRDPKPAASGSETAQASHALGPGGSATVFEAAGPGHISALRLRVPGVAHSGSGVLGDDGRAFGAGGASTFTVAVDPANSGVRLTRRIDPGVVAQHATVAVDGTVVGSWEPSPAGPAGTWADQVVELPPAATAGKSRLTIRNDFVSSSLDFNEFTYTVDHRVGGVWVRADSVDVGSGHLADEAAHHYTITGQTWEGTRAFTYPGEPAGGPRLGDCRIRISFDGARTVDAPLDEFFATPGGKTAVHSLTSAVELGGEGWFTSWWPMPYRESVSVELYNTGSTAVDPVEVAVTTVADRSWEVSLESGAAGYFHATSHAGTPKVGEDWVFLETAGHGKVVGVAHGVQGLPGAGKGFLEGDERVFVDGMRSPALHGTGTEDFYHGGWFFLHGPFTGTFDGQPADGGAGCPAGSSCVGMYRLLVADAWAFGSAIEAGIEHGGANDAVAAYSSTTFWYGEERATTLVETDVLDVGNTTSEAAHGYRPAADPPGVLDATYEAGGGTAGAVNDNLRPATTPVTFTLALDPGNTGVVLRRASDQHAGGQQVRVSVDGTAAGTWRQPLENRSHRWLDDEYLLPASATAGKTRITVTLAPEAGSPPWVAAGYRALCLVPARPLS